MGYIEKRVSSRTREVSYRAKVRVKGYPPQTATFPTKTAADRWAQRTEADLRENKYFPGAKARKHTVADLIDEYLGYVKAKNPRRHGDVRRLLEWWKTEIGYILSPILIVMSL